MTHLTANYRVCGKMPPPSGVVLNSKSAQYKWLPHRCVISAQSTRCMWFHGLRAAQVRHLTFEAVTAGTKRRAGTECRRRAYLADPIICSNKVSLESDRNIRDL